MSILPLRPHLQMYRGSKENQRRKNHEYNIMAQRVADHLNRLIANDPDTIQQYIFDSIAMELGLKTDQVRKAISDGGYNGITIRVGDKDRVALARYKK